MNRQQRRRQARARRQHLHSEVGSSLCPDCNADARTVELAPGVVVLEIAHDGTCPNLTRMESTTERTQR